MDLLSYALCHTAHPGLRSHIGPISVNLSWCKSSSRESKRRCNLSLRSRAERVRSELQQEKPFEIPKRDWFDRKFLFGAATSAYQIEGAWNEGGKGPSNWDHFCHTHPERIMDGSNADVAANSYHMYEEDVRLLKEMGMSAYRFSISWSRILPKGTLDGGINKEGIQYYKNLINLLKDNGIEPYVTIFHWDIPQVLEDMYGGFLDRTIVKDYTDYAKVCFQHFGDKVKNWITFNEPRTFCNFGYGKGNHAPGRCSPGHNCAVPNGDSLSEPYRVGHNILLAHAEAVELYNKYYKGDEGKIGMAIDVVGYEPHASTLVDKQSQQRSYDFSIGWFMEPLFRGDYPFAMRALVGHRLPYFKDEEKKKLKGSYSMVGLNYYSSTFSKHIDPSPLFSPTVNTEDAHAKEEEKNSNGKTIGPDLGLGWVKLYPEGLKDLLLIMKDKYGNPPMYITENGTADWDGGASPRPIKDMLDDTKRLDYIQRHIAILKDAIDLGANLQGYFAWTLLDNFEWDQGYTLRFGIVYVDFKNGQKRYMKKSAIWLAEFNNDTSSRKTIADYEILKPALVRI